MNLRFTIENIDNTTVAGKKRIKQNMTSKSAVVRAPEKFEDIQSGI